jgi:hypothetical protein
VLVVNPVFGRPFVAVVPFFTAGLAAIFDRLCAEVFFFAAVGVFLDFLADVDTFREDAVCFFALGAVPFFVGVDLVRVSEVLRDLSFWVWEIRSVWAQARNAARIRTPLSLLMGYPPA